ncbi:predicted protein [Streptomyces iranensis]|uniref:Uncharacterized protein n=1 Tax=Streptomyces iranensis TaxID=576784 RepID=A0A060ZNV5_9ACTN|nr:predicted protein [Streptomyces iranensis]
MAVQERFCRRPQRGGAQMPVQPEDDLDRVPVATAPVMDTVDAVDGFDVMGGVDVMHGVEEQPFLQGRQRQDIEQS